jgi:hypothetical protein
MVHNYLCHLHSFHGFLGSFMYPHEDILINGVINFESRFTYAFTTNEQVCWARLGEWMSGRHSVGDRFGWSCQRLRNEDF